MFPGHDSASPRSNADRQPNGSGRTSAHCHISIDSSAHCCANRNAHRCASGRTN